MSMEGRDTWKHDGLPNSLARFERPPVPKHKTIGFESLQVSYDYGTQILAVENNEGDGFSFTQAEIAELRQALLLFGLEVPSGSGVTCR